MAATFTIYGYNDNPRTQIVKIVAAIQDIPLSPVEVVPRKGINKIAYMKVFPLSQGKIPALQGPDIRLTETIAITYYLAKLQPQTRLLGSLGTPAQESRVMQFVSFANQELLQTLARWFLPLMTGFTDPAPYSHQAVEQGKSASLTLLRELEHTLASSETEWLVGNCITLADVFVAVVLGRGLQRVLGRAWREAHPACMAHFERVMRLEPVIAVLPRPEMVEEEPPNVQPARV